jgi:hypothetical protein
MIEEKPGYRGYWFVGKYLKVTQYAQGGWDRQKQIANIDAAQNR